MNFKYLCVCADLSVALSQQNTIMKFKINAFFHKFSFNLGSSLFKTFVAKTKVDRNISKRN